MAQVGGNEVLTFSSLPGVGEGRQDPTAPGGRAAGPAAPGPGPWCSRLQTCRRRANSAELSPYWALVLSL